MGVVKEERSVCTHMYNVSDSIRNWMCGWEQVDACVNFIFRACF